MSVHDGSRRDFIDAAVKYARVRQRQEMHLTSVLVLMVFWALTAAAVCLFFPGRFPIDQDLLWTGKPVGAIAMSSWPLLAWGFGVSLLVGLLVKRVRSDRIAASIVHKYNMLVSVQAGVFEELIFRFFAFIAMIGIMPIMNWILFGLLEWMYGTVLVPMANWLTFGKMTNLLFTTPWFVGAALLSANAMFRDGHKYLGLVGMINSWYVGMFMFWVMFEYGLVAAIVLHIVYDVIVFSVEHLDVLWDNR